jgi:hypothetical protein
MNVVLIPTQDLTRRVNVFQRVCGSLHTKNANALQSIRMVIKLLFLFIHLLTEIIKCKTFSKNTGAGRELCDLKGYDCYLENLGLKNNSMLLNIC